MKFSTFTGTFDTRAKINNVDLATFAKGILTPVANGEDKKKIPMWSPTTFNGSRAKLNAHSVNALVFDIDDGLTPFDTWRLFTMYAVLAHTSYSHKPAHHKYRVILPLAKPIPAGDWDRASQAANQLWQDIVGRGEPDQSAINDVARAYYRYTHRHTIYKPGHPMHIGEYAQTAKALSAPLLDLDYSQFAAAPPPKPRPQLRGTSKKTLSDAMKDTNVRNTIANHIGASIMGNVARDIVCPSCGKREVYFSIEVDRGDAVVWPRCNRQNKCGWWGSFEDLIGGTK
jgi:hypothetical protein